MIVNFIFDYSLPQIRFSYRFEIEEWLEMKKNPFLNSHAYNVKTSIVKTKKESSNVKIIT